jgi:hypothetical protein
LGNPVALAISLQEARAKEEITMKIETSIKAGTPTIVEAGVKE